jgi:excisionase family DNA binding protein
MEFSIFVELDRNTEPDAEQIERLVDLSADYHGAWGMSPHGWLSVQLTIQAETLRSATDLAFLLLPDLANRAGLGWHTPLSVEAMSSVEFDRRQVEPVIPELVSTAEAAVILGVSEQAVRQQAERGLHGAFRVGKTWVLPRSRVEQAASSLSGRQVGRSAHPWLRTMEGRPPAGHYDPDQR